MQREFRNSEIAKYMRCPRSWMLSYYRQLEPMWGERLQPKAFDVGNAVHAGLGAFYPDHDLNAALDAISLNKSEMLANLDENANFKDWDKVWAKAVAMVSNYPAWLNDNGFDIGEDTVAIEKRMYLEMGQFHGDSVVLHGQPDIIKHCDSGYILEDWKTGSIARPTLMESDWQLLNYALMIEDTYGSRPFEVRHRRLNPSMHTSRVKAPQYAEESVSFNADRMDTHREHLLRVISEMVVKCQELDSGMYDPVFACRPVRIERNCGWDCSFLDVCSQMDDSADWEHTLTINYRPREMQ